MAYRMVIVVHDGFVGEVHTNIPDDIELEIIDLDGDDDDTAAMIDELVSDCGRGNLRTIY